MTFSARILFTVVVGVMTSHIVQAQSRSPTREAKGTSGLVTFANQEDHRNMMQQPGITKLRHGPSGKPNAENTANYDEALANAKSLGFTEDY